VKFPELTCLLAKRSVNIWDQQLFPRDYDFLGLAYHRREGAATGLIIFHYADASSAEKDLPVRQNFLENGFSYVAKKKYSEALFTLKSISVDDDLLIAEVTPYNDMPRRIFQMVATRDLGFAACNP
jgi:hypothetical protein